MWIDRPREPVGRNNFQIYLELIIQLFLTSLQSNKYVRVSTTIIGDLLINVTSRFSNAKCIFLLQADWIYIS